MSELNPKNRGLGRGLNALFEDNEESVSLRADPSDPVAKRETQTLPVEQIEPNSSQPRQSFDKQALSELASSLKEHGMLQPILVRAVKTAKDRYEIVAGERRWRAAQKAQLHEVPVIVRDLDDEQAYQIALIENLQRTDLDPIDEALGYQKMIDAFGYTQEKLAKVIGKSRPHIANTLRLLNLPENVRRAIHNGELTAGHARVLVTAEDPESLAEQIRKKGLSVREAERIGRAKSGKVKKPAAKAGGHKKDADTVALEEEISAVLGMKVSIDTKNGKQGTLTVSFKDLDQLDSLLGKLSSPQAPRRLMT